MPPRVCLILILAFLGIGAFAQKPTPKTEDYKFGKLPPSQLSTWGLYGVRAEIVLYHLIDPELIKRELPKGFRPVTVSDLAKNVPTVAKWLETHPKYSGYISGTLLFTSLDSLEIDGHDIGQRGPVDFASWWIEGFATAPLDLHVVSQAGIQLASWYPESGIDRKGLPSDPTIAFGKVEVVNTKPGEWRVHLKFKGGEITGECHEAGVRTEMKYDLPAYSTIFFGGPDPGHYVVYTYYGHYSRDMRADWKFSGNDALISSLSFSKANYPIFTILSDGWRARAGFYELKK